VSFFKLEEEKSCLAVATVISPPHKISFLSLLPSFVSFLFGPKNKRNYKEKKCPLHQKLFYIQKDVGRDRCVSWVTPKKIVSKLIP
jgi:hypothetical protein